MISSKMMSMGLALCLLTGSALAGSVYKWKDADGNVHYGDQQPQGLSSQRLNIHTGESSSSSGEGTTGKDNSKASAATGDATQSAQKMGKAQADNCDAARKNLEIINSFSRITVEENGQKRYLTPDEIAQKKKGYQAIVDRDCAQ